VSEKGKGARHNQRTPLGTSVKMLEDHYVKLSDDATGEVVEAHGFKLGSRVVKAA
jgi:hypothetical protein